LIFLTSEEKSRIRIHNSVVQVHGSGALKANLGFA
jgi:hypothetical protein